MPYVRRRRRGGTRRGAAAPKKVLWRRPTARAQKSQIYSLSKTVGRLQARWLKMGTKQTWTEYGQINLYSSDPSGQGYQYLPLMNPPTWGQIFATTNVAGQSNKTLVDSITMGLRFAVYAQPAPVVYHVFIVSLKRTAGTMDIAALQNGAHFETAPKTTWHGMDNVVLNPKCFKIHRQRCFTLSTLAESKNIPTQAGQGYPPCSWKQIKWRLYPKATLRNYKGDWKVLEELDLPVTQRYYMLVFFDNSYPTSGSGGEAYNRVAYSNQWVTKNMF